MTQKWISLEKPRLPWSRGDGTETFYVKEYTHSNVVLALPAGNLPFCPGITGSFLEEVAPLNLRKLHGVKSKLLACLFLKAPTFTCFGTLNLSRMMKISLKLFLRCFLSCQGRICFLKLLKLLSLAVKDESAF